MFIDTIYQSGTYTRTVRSCDERGVTSRLIWSWCEALMLMFMMGRDSGIRRWRVVREWSRGHEFTLFLLRTYIKSAWLTDEVFINRCAVRVPYGTKYTIVLCCVFCEASSVVPLAGLITSHENQRYQSSNENRLTNQAKILPSLQRITEAIHFSLPWIITSQDGT